jgi:hypothetical protein
VTAAIAISGMPVDEPIEAIVEQLQEASHIIAPPPI